MLTLHDTGKLTAFGHENYRPYNVYRGKLASLSPTGRVYRCPECDGRYISAEARDAHRCRAALTQARPVSASAAEYADGH